MAARKQREAGPSTQLRELEGALGSGLARGYILRGEERYFQFLHRDRSSPRSVGFSDGLHVEFCP